MTKTAAESFAELRALKDRFADALRVADVSLIADVVLRSGWHPYREGRGRALLEVLVQRHRQSPRPIVPEITQRDVRELADELGIDPDFQPTRRLEID